MNREFWNGKKVLVTGHTGFKGSWLAIWLTELGADVTGYSLDPEEPKCNFTLSRLADQIRDIRGDIRDEKKLQQAFQIGKPEVVFHLAAQSLVRKGYTSPRETWDVNVMGTFSVLECIRNTPEVKSAVIITTDKCYENNESGRPFKESDVLGGYDPYSASKACAEILTASCRSSFMNPAEGEKHRKSVATARAGNAIGGGDWSKDRIVPDCIRALETDTEVKLRNPDATRPWQHVLEALSGYILLAEKSAADPDAYAEGWNFGPEPEGIATVGKLVEMVMGHAMQNKKKFSVGISHDSYGRHPHEAKMLTLDIGKAKEKLGWRPALTLDECVEMTVDWYMQYKERDAFALATDQIRAYTKRRQELMLQK